MATAAKRTAAPVEAPAAEVEEDKGERPKAPFIPAIILRNKGVPITLLRLENGQAIPRPDDLDDEDPWEPPTRNFHLRFTANHVADIEEAFDGIKASVPVVERTAKLMDGKVLEGPAGAVYEEKVVGYEDRTYYGMEAFQMAMTVKMATTTRKVLAIALGVSEEEAGNAMDPGRMNEYQNAVGVAWSIAQGVDPTEAAKVLQAGAEAMAAAKARMASDLSKTMGQASE